ncbi:uncharacterized protein LODBEIA_P19600 [Lodderomyces beijingensis]|uniref:NADH-ubiquinone oxidoreductase 21 kDa subunit n=1 Tax=Lodderomyces beijingensis TaxID=1775926 RepID=A0ABP0ZHW8_9ASCO
MSYSPSNQPVRAAPLDSDYERIDGDPYFTRVVSYFRPSDYLNWAISVAAIPAGLKLWEHLEPANGTGLKPARISGASYRAAVAIGLTGGFLLAYIRSSYRFLGWRENAREVAKDRYEMKKLLSQGKLPYHEDESALDDRGKDIANRNSQYSASMLYLLPWFNLAYHPYHQTNLEKYYENRPGEEEWGFKLKPLDEIYANANKSKYS